MWPFKRKPEPEVIEVTLGENDLLIIETDHYLSKQQREIITQNFDAAFRDKTNKFLTLEGGMKFKVVHRT
jgi:hypothetical protein